MGKWLSKDPDAYLPDRPRRVQPYPERAREHALRHDGPPYAEDWRDVTPRWRLIGAWVVLWAALAYAAAVTAGVNATIDTLVLGVPVVTLGRSEARHWHGAGLNARRDLPSVQGHPFGGAPWLVVFALHVAVVFGIAGAVALLTTDEGAQRVAILACGFIAGAAGWLADWAWGRAERRAGVPKTQPRAYV